VVRVHPDAAPLEGELESHRVTILVGDQMRVEISSLSFEIEALYPATQELDVDSGGVSTVWLWNCQS
jgi:hypothetical protein